MTSKSFSIGVAGITLNGVRFGSNTAASISVTITTVPIHADKVGEAKIVGSKFVVKSMQGVLNFTTEELGLVADIIGCMNEAIKGNGITEVSFDCLVPLTGGSITGKVMLLPMLSVAANPGGWATLSFKLPIVGPLNGNGGSLTTTDIGGISFIGDLADKSAYTTDTDNLCAEVEASVSTVFGSVGDLSMDTSCQYRPIYRDDVPWPKSYVLDSASIVADIGFYDFTGLGALYESETSASVTFKTLGGGRISINLGTCAAAFSGMKTSAGGFNTWNVRVEGNAI